MPWKQILPCKIEMGTLSNEIFKTFFKPKKYYWTHTILSQKIQKSPQFSIQIWFLTIQPVVKIKFIQALQIYINVIFKILIFSKNLIVMALWGKTVQLFNKYNLILFWFLKIFKEIPISFPLDPFFSGLNVWRYRLSLPPP